MLTLTSPGAQKPAATAGLSALVLADRLLTLAQAAERAGYSASASHLVQLAHTVFDEQPRGNGAAWTY